MQHDPRLDKPRNSTTVDKLQREREKQKAAEAIMIENMEEFAKALNDVAGSPSGKLFLRTLIKACGVFIPDLEKDGVTLVENKAKRNLYLQLVRPFLEPKLKQELEE